MTTLDVIELKACVPALDFELSKRFYLDLGFILCWSDPNMAHLHPGDDHGHSAAGFILERHYVKEVADNLAMYLLVRDASAWWAKVREKRIVERYGVCIDPPQQEQGRVREFGISDPSGVLWRIAQEPATTPRARK